MIRVRTDYWVGALCRRVVAAGSFATVVCKGAEEAGAVFVLVNRLDGTFDLYGPAPQAWLDEAGPLERSFSGLLAGVSQAQVDERMEQERRFDTDLWLVEVEDRAGQPHVPVHRDSPAATQG